MIDVCSANGFLTRGEDTVLSNWVSDEDLDRFSRVKNSHRLLVMGSKTYEAIRPKPQSERLRVVLTSRPQDFLQDMVPGQLEFTSQEPVALVSDLEVRGYTSLLLLGGGLVNAAFLAAGLVDELDLTIEPVLFGNGTPLIATAELEAKLQLLSVEKLNERGTLLLHYRVNKSTA